MEYIQLSFRMGRDGWHNTTDNMWYLQRNIYICIHIYCGKWLSIWICFARKFQIKISCAPFICIQICCWMWLSILICFIYRFRSQIWCTSCIYIILYVVENYSNVSKLSNFSHRVCKIESVAVDAPAAMEQFKVLLKFSYFL